jgi:uncharacterized damage-inducible protein DinB
MIALVLAGGLLTGPYPNTEAPASDVVSYQFANISGFALKAAELMPESEYGFRPVDSIRTFGQLVGHLADAGYATCSLAAKQRNPNTRTFESLETKAVLVDALGAARDYCIGIFAMRSAGTLAKELPGMFPFAEDGTVMTGDDVVYFTMAHTYEHYGNMVIYLRMKGIEPPSTTITRAVLAGRGGGAAGIPVTPAPVAGGTTAVAPNTGLRLTSLEPYLVDRATEIALARSAGPPAVGANATVLVLQRDGSYDVAAHGTNDFVCFLGRAWTGPAPVRSGRRLLGRNHLDPAVVAPQCFNSLAVSSVLEWHKMTTRLLFEGRTTEEVEDVVQAALKSGQLPIPVSGAMSYMLSPHQQLGNPVGRFRPHLMFYTPYASSFERFGTKGLSMDWPFVTDEGGPWAISTVPVAHFSDGSS